MFLSASVSLRIHIYFGIFYKGMIMGSKTVTSIETKFAVELNVKKTKYGTVSKKSKSSKTCHGTLRIGKKGIEWIAAGAYQTQRQMSWEMFAALMEFDAC